MSKFVAVTIWPQAAFVKFNRRVCAKMEAVNDGVSYRRGPTRRSGLSLNVEQMAAAATFHRVRRTRRHTLFENESWPCKAPGYTPTKLSAEAAVALDPEGQGFCISLSVLILCVKVPNLDEATFAWIASDTEKNCPVSKVLSIKITLDAKLV